MNDCIFCSIVSGGAESSTVYADGEVIAFMDIQPVTPGHLLVVPREHLATLADVPPPLAAHIFTVGQRLAAALRESTLPCEGINMFVADGEVAFQEVFHFHLHVFPRTRSDTFRISADWRARSRDELDTAAVAIRQAIDRQVQIMRSRRVAIEEHTCLARCDGAHQDDHVPHPRLALAGVIVAVAFISACSGSSSASSPPPAGSARDPRDLVLVAQIASGTHWDGFAEQFIKMEGVEATDGNGSTFTVSMRADATLRDYMRVRAALAATPGLSAVVERTSTGTTLGVPPRGQVPFTAHYRVTQNARTGPVIGSGRGWMVMQQTRVLGLANVSELADVSDYVCVLTGDR